MTTKPPVPQYAVMGNPISHSLSPQIHSEFGKQTGISLNYSAILVPLDGFPASVKHFQQQGGKGLNITVPFKEEAFRLMPECSDRAMLARAVNTIIFSTDSMRGDNTDGIGLLRDLTINHGESLTYKHILILGAGGATRGILGPLLSEKPLQLMIANRTESKAHELEKEFKSYGPVSSCGFDALENKKFDLIINATSASLKNEFPPLPNDLLAPQGCCYDLVYSQTLTPFLQWGKQHGARQIIDGLGMLVEQAAEAFYLWHGIMPVTQPVITQLKNR